MKHFLISLGLSLILTPSIAQKHSEPTKKTVHILTPFNGMHSGFNDDGSSKQYLAQAATIKQIVDFTPQNNASNPAYKFGYFQMVYDQKPNVEPIQLTFTLPPNQDFTVELSVTTNVDNSSFKFNLSGNSKIMPATNGANVIHVTFKGNATGAYNLTIDPIYKMDATTFLLTEIKIITL